MPRGLSLVIATFIVYVIIAVSVSFSAGPYFGGLAIILGSVVFYVSVAWIMKAATVEEFYVAGRRVPAVVNGAATAADWMSGASFISMAGAIAVLGYDAMPFIIGWTLGYVLAAFFIAPYVRRSETYTVPEFIEARSGWAVARLVSVVMLFVVSLTYLTAQLVGVGVVISRFLGIPAAIGAYIGVLLVVLYATTGGWKSVTWTQFTQYVVLITMYWLPVMIASYSLGLFKPWPHFSYGEILQELQAREQQFGLPAWTEPYARAFAGGTGQLNWVLSAIVLMLGTIGLPHILVRFYTVPDVHRARLSVGWALVFIGLLYTTAPLYALIARYAFSQVWGMEIETAKQVGWISKWLPTGLVSLKDANGDGVLQPAELSFHRDIVVVGMPDMFGMVWVISALVATGGLAAALSTADGLLLAMTTAITRDIYKRFINPAVTERREILAARITLVIVALLAGTLGYLAILDPTFRSYVALIVGWAFVFAASSFTPAIILGIFWRGLNRYGIVAGMIVGMLVALPYVVGVGVFGMPPLEIAGQKIGTIAWGFFSFLANLIVSVLVSLATGGEKAIPPDIKRFIVKMRIPE